MVGVATLGQGQGGLVMVSQTDVALISSYTSSPGHGVVTDQISPTGSNNGLLVSPSCGDTGTWTWLVAPGLVDSSSR